MICQSGRKACAKLARFHVHNVRWRTELQDDFWLSGTARGAVIRVPLGDVAITRFPGVLSVRLHARRRIDLAEPDRENGVTDVALRLPAPLPARDAA